MEPYDCHIYEKRSHWDRVLSFYCIFALISLTFSQKIINVALYRPYLYVGMGLILLHIFYLCSQFLIRRKTRVAKISILVAFLLCIQLITALTSLRAVKDFIITTITQLAFVVSLVAYSKLIGFDLLVRRVAGTLVIFALFEAIMAWLLFAGVSISIGGETYAHLLYTWGERLHGVAGEPTHLGAIMGIGILSAFFWFGGRGRKLSFGNMVVICILSGSLLMSGTRNAILSTVVGLLIFFRYCRGSFRLSQYTWLLLAAACILFFFLAPVDELFQITKALLRIGDSGSENIRLTKYTNTLFLFFNSNPKELFFGRGFAFIRLNPSVMNQYLEILVGFGLLGFFCFHYIIGLAVIRLKGLFRIRRDIAAYGLALLLFSLIFFSFTAPLFDVFYIVVFVFYFSLFISFFRYHRYGVIGICPLTGRALN